MLQLVFTIFFMVWLSAMLFFLILIWFSNARHVRRIEQTLIDTTLRASEAAVTAAKVAEQLTQKLPEVPT